MSVDPNRRLAAQISQLRAVREARRRSAEAALARTRAGRIAALAEARSCREDVLAATARLAGLRAERAAAFEARQPDAFVRLLGLGQRQLAARDAIAELRAVRRRSLAALREARHAAAQARAAWALAVRGEEKVDALDALLGRGATDPWGAAP